MSKSSESREVTLEYVGPENRRYRDLPALVKGATVVVSGARSKALLATKSFVKVQKPTAEKSAGKE